MAIQEALPWSKGQYLTDELSRHYVATSNKSCIPVERYNPLKIAKAKGGTSDWSAVFAEAIALLNQNRAARITIPEGEFVVNTPLQALNAPGSQLVGSGRNRTVIVPSSSFPVDGDVLTVKSKEATGTNTGCLLSDFAVAPEARQPLGSAIAFLNGYQHNIERVRFSRIEGQAINAKNTWDSTFFSAVFDNCGSATQAIVELSESIPEVNGFYGCNNLAFFAFQFEQNYGTCLSLLAHTRKCRFIGGKTHGRLPSPEPGTPPIVLDGAYTNTFTGSNFATAGGDHVQIRGGSYGNSFQGNSFDSAYFGGAGIRIIDGERNSFDGNLFGLKASNSGGAVIAEGGLANVYGSANITSEVVEDLSPGQNALLGSFSPLPLVKEVDASGIEIDTAPFYASLGDAATLPVGSRRRAANWSLPAGNDGSQIPSEPIYRLTAMADGANSWVREI